MCYNHLIRIRTVNQVSGFLRNLGSRSPLTGHSLLTAQQGSGYENLDQDQGVPRICFITLDLVFYLPPQLSN